MDVRFFAAVVVGLVLFSSGSQAFNFNASGYAVYEKSTGSSTKDIYVVAKESVLILHGDIATPIMHTPPLSGLIATLYSDGTLGNYRQTNLTWKDAVSQGMSVSSYKLYGGDFSGDGKGDLLLQGSGSNRSVIVASDAGGFYTYYDFQTSLNGSQIAVTDADQNGKADLLVTDPSSHQYLLLGSDNGAWFVSNDRVSLQNVSLIGSVDANFHVDAQGAANYSLNILAAPGTAGVTPKISLNYSSAAGQGIAGQGWSIGGLSEITRCRQTLVQDGRTRAVGLNQDDRFCLDGQRLILSSGVAYGAVGAEYRTEIESYAVIKSVGGSYGHPDHFTVQRKDGSFSHYGNGNGSTAILGGRTVSWGISRFQDSGGNPIRFSYTTPEFIPGSFPLPVPGSDDSRRIARIDYAYGSNTAAISNSSTYIEFQYENRPDPVRGFVAGKEIKQGQRLIAVRSVSGNTELRNYQLVYRYAASATTPSYVEKIFECVGGACLPPLQFRWSYSQPGFASGIQVATAGGTVPISLYLPDVNGDGKYDIAYVERSGNSANLVYRLSNGSGFSGGGSLGTGLIDSAPDSGVITVDYNNDGFQDLLVGKPGSNWRIYPGNAQGNYSSWLDSGVPYYKDTRAVDLNSDGLPDLAYVVGESLRYRPMVRTENGAQWVYHFGGEQVANLIPSRPENPLIGAIEHGTVTPLPEFADFDGDGKIDVMVRLVDTKMEIKYVDLSCNCMQPTGKYIYSRYYGVYRQGDDGVFSALSWTYLGETTTGGIPFDYAIKIDDINSDGFPDFWAIDPGLYLESVPPITILYKFNPTWSFTINDGVTLRSERLFPNRTSNHQFSHVDYDGDGYRDAIFPFEGWLRVRLFNSKLNQFNEALLDTGIPFESQDKDRYSYQDVDGDGHVDVIHSHFNGTANTVHLYKSRNAGRVIGRIVKIDAGLGKTYNINYKNLTDGTVYTKASDANNRSLDLPSGHASLGKPHTVYDVLIATPVVSSFSVSSPAGGVIPGTVNQGAMRTISYLYEGAKVEASVRGWLGFRRITETDNQTGIQTITTYRQDFPFIGMPLYVETKNSAGFVVNRVESRYAFAEYNGGNPPHPLRVFADLVKETTGDPASGQQVALTTTTNGPLDIWGNLEGATVATSAAGSPNVYAKQVQTTNEFGSTSTDKQFGRLTRSTVVHRRSGVPDIVRTTAFEYRPAIFDGQGRLTGDSLLLWKEVVEPDDTGDLKSITEHGYDQFGNRIKTSRSSAEGERYVGWQYDAAGRYLERTIERFPMGESLVEVVTARNAFGSPTEIVRPTNGIAPGAVSSPASIHGLTPGALLVTQIQYDLLGRERYRSDSTGAAVSTTISRSGLVVGAAYKVTRDYSGGGSDTEYFDLLGRGIAKSKTGFDGLPILTWTEYDNAGRVKRQSAPHRSGQTIFWTGYQHDDIGRIIRIDEPGFQGQRSVSQISYTPNLNDQSGTYAWYINRSNALAQNKAEYWGYGGELSKVVDYAGASVAYAYDATGNMLSVTRKDNDTSPTKTIVSGAEYDRLGRKVKMFDPDKGTSFYRYNPSGELIDQYKVASVRNYSGSLDQAIAAGEPMLRTQIIYDLKGRMILRRDYREDSIDRVDIWEYDTGLHGLGLLARSIGGGLTQTYSYNLGRPEGVVHEDGNGLYMLVTEYDNVGRIAFESDVMGTGSGLRHHYNNFGYLHRLTDGWTGDEVYAVQQQDLRGRPSQVLLGNGTTSQQLYDDASGLLSEQVVSLGAATLQSLTYEWDVLGNLQSRHDQGQIPGGGHRDLRQEYCYDGLNRLIKTYGHGSGNCAISTAQQDQEYDAFGNITRKGGALYSYGTSLDGPNAVTAVTGLGSLTYDRQGNLITDGTGRNLLYTVFDKPYRLSKGGTVVDFSYGADHRVYKRVDSVDGQITTTYTIGNSEKVAKPDGSVTFRRNLGDFAIFSLPAAGGATGPYKREYIHRDALGSINLITGNNGAVNRLFAYGTFGERVDAADGATPLPLAGFMPVELQPTLNGYTGHEMVDSLGIIHMGGRIYDARLGRFLQADPLVADATSTQAFNRYSYVLNNPVSLIDPSGYSPFSMGGDGGFGNGLCAGGFCLNIQGGYGKKKGWSYEINISGGQAIYADLSRAPTEWNVYRAVLTSFSNTSVEFMGRVLGAGQAGADRLGDYAARASSSDAVLGLLLSGSLSDLTGGKFTNGIAGSAFADAIFDRTEAGSRSLEEVLVTAPRLLYEQMELQKASDLKTFAHIYWNVVQFSPVGPGPEIFVFKTAGGVGKIAKGVTNPEVGKLVRPSIPEGMTQSQFGKELIGWGARPEGALQRIGTINSAEVARMQQQGLTREMAIQWRNFYSNEFSRNANNVTARNRVELMQRILDNWR